MTLKRKRALEALAEATGFTERQALLKAIWKSKQTETDDDAADSDVAATSSDNPEESSDDEQEAMLAEV